jgi:outer membrane receptor protein involved in Fe transport
MKKNILTLAIQVAVFGGLAVSVEQAHAFQEQAVEKQTIKQNKTVNEKDLEKDVEKIVVTGSRLRRDSFSVATPLATVDREAIEDYGVGSLSNILLEELPSISAGDSNTTSQSGVNSTGLSTIDLRNLGSSRTLTLIDGRRTVSNSYSSNKVSLSTIPTGMVEKVEVITGGASAAYGSDAIAGVVNIITQQYKEGLELKAKGSESTEGGAKEFSLSLSYGTDFDDGRGYLFMAGDYAKEYGLKFSDRKRAQQQMDLDYDDDLMCNTVEIETGEVCLSETTPDQWRRLSDGLPGGVFGENRRNDTQFWYDANGLRNDWRGNEEKYGINSNQFVQLQVPEDSASVALKMDYELTDDFQAYFQVQYSTNGSLNYKSPEDGNERSSRDTYDVETGEFGLINLGYIPIDNPYVPQELLDADLYKDRIYWDRRFNEVGQITTDNTRDTMRVWGGLQGTAFDGDWDWDLSVGYGKFTQRQIRSNELYVQNFRNAVDAEKLDDGTIQCASAEARANGCVPLNIFGEGSITPDAADYIRANPTINADIEQLTLLGYIAGDLFSMPAGPVASVFGFEYREDSQSLSTNVPEGGITFNYVPTFSGEVDIAEVFAEMAFPLLRNVTAAKNIDLEISARIADYSSKNIDLIGSYRAGLMWEIADGYAVRANYSRAQRAPSITELESPKRGNYTGYDDICDNLTATSDDAGHDNCRLEPTLAKLLADDPGFEFEDENPAFTPKEGNDQLFEETGDTYTFGITMAPAFLDGFQVAIDYYDIKISDVISSFESEAIINACYDSSIAWGQDNSFCNDISRDDDGQIKELVRRNYNLDERRTRGYDVAMAYRYDLNEYGSLKFKLALNHVIEWSETAETNGELISTDRVGDLAYDNIFRDKASASIAWSKDNWRVRWSTSYKSASVNDKERHSDWLGYMEDNDENCANADDACVTNPEALAYYDVGSYIKHNLSFKYSTKLSDNTKIRFNLGIRNLFDNNGDFRPGSRHYYSTFGGGVGRRYTAGVTVKF